MIDFFSETNFTLSNKVPITQWIKDIVLQYEKELGEIVYIFCDDAYLHKLNLSFLNHDTLTDIISFDNSLGNLINGEIYISVQRVKENAGTYSVSFEDELHRVIIHGILHFCGLKDKTDTEAKAMRAAEDNALQQLKDNYPSENQ